MTLFPFTLEHTYSWRDSAAIRYIDEEDWNEYAIDNVSEYYEDSDDNSDCDSDYETAASWDEYAIDNVSDYYGDSDRDSEYESDEGDDEYSSGDLSAGDPLYASEFSEDSFTSAFSQPIFESDLEYVDEIQCRHALDDAKCCCLPQCSWESDNAVSQQYPDQGDRLVAVTLARIKALKAQPRYFHLASEFYPDEVEFGSGIVREDEERYGIEVYDMIFAKDDIYSEGGWALDLRLEDAFGDNPEYVETKLLWWEKKLGICGMEAIVRYHCEFAQAINALEGAESFMSVDDEIDMNWESSDYGGSPRFRGHEPSKKLPVEYLPRGRAVCFKDWILEWQEEVDEKAISYRDFFKGLRELHYESKELLYNSKE